MPNKYEVGYGNPPKYTQFKPGLSGNPKGRPKAAKNFKTDLTEEMNELVQITEGGRSKTISKQRAILKRTVEKALKADMRAVDLIIKWVSNYLQIMDEQEDIVQQISSDDRAILNNYIAEQTKNKKNKYTNRDKP